MNYSITNELTFLLIAGSGLVAGIFFAFSNFVMAALGKVTPEQGIRAMQTINITVLNRGFIGLFLGTAAGYLILTVLAVMGNHNTSTFYLVIGAALYLVGSLLVTVIFNIPLNDSLAAIKANSSEGEKLWSCYLKQWTQWNSVRTLASFAAMISLMFAVAH